MHVLVIGAGAIGCLFGRGWRKPASPSPWSPRPNRAQDLRRTGVRLTEADGRVVAPNINIVGGVGAALTGATALIWE